VGGPIARTVMDAAAYLDVVAGTRLRGTANEHIKTPVPAAWSATLGFADVDPEVAAVARGAMRRLADSDLIAPMRVPVLLGDPQQTWLALRADAGEQPSVHVDRELNSERLGRLFSQVDVLITPTTPNRPHGHDGFGETMSTALTWAFNLSGHPALSVLAGFTSDGCPVGVQFVARHGDEATLIRLGAAWERLSPWPSPVLL
jgi:Asp-tRNA(Asn)/Glu-tRNA(Gln) amidotransferase A subunit family amidase